MRGLRVCVVVALAAVVVAAACTSFESSSPDVPEAGSDATPPPPPPPGAPDSAADAPARTDGGRFCATQADAAFCDDFDDDGGSILFEWQSLELFDAGGTAAISSSDFSSPPNGAVFHQNAVTTPRPSGLRLVNRALGARVPFGCELAWKADALSSADNDGANVMTAVVSPQGQGAVTRLEVYIVVGSGGLFSVEWSPYANSDAGIETSEALAAPAEKVGTWRKLRIEADAANVAVLVDGMKVATKAHGFGSAVSYDLFVGAQTFVPATDSTGWTFAYDDIVCR